MTSRIRVLHCIPTAGGGGAERQIQLLLPALVELGCDVALYSRLEPPRTAFFSARGVQCRSIAGMGNYDVRQYVALRRFIRQWRPSLVQTWLSQMDVIGGFAASAAKVPFILSERAAPDAYAPGSLTRLRRWAGSKAAMIVANSSVGLNVWAAHPVKRYVPNAIDFEAIAAAEPADPAELDLSADDEIVLTACRLAKQKNLETLIGAMALVRRSRPRAKLLICGLGELEQHLKTVAMKAGLQDGVIFAGHRADLWGWMKLAELFVSTSLFEGQPNSVLEAAASKLPLVLSDIAEHTDLFRDGEVLFAKTGSAESFAAAILARLEAPDRARTAAVAARARIEKQSVDAIARRYLELYRECLAGARR